MKTAFPLLSVVVLAVSACANSAYEPILDGPRTSTYLRDLAACRQLAETKKQSNAGRNGGAIIGALIAVADSDSGDEVPALIAGAVIGGMLGSTEDSSGIKTERDAIVFQCLRGRGHNVVG